jgi:uncharacterized protein
MEIEPVAPDRRLLVQGYRAGGFSIAGMRHDGAIVLTPEHARPWHGASPDAIDASGLGSLRTAEPPVDLLIIGTGARFRPLSPAVTAELRSWGIVVEAMATPSACRTYNVLVADGRRVAAALLPMP